MGWFGVPSFISKRRRSLAVVAGTLGTGYLITKWAIKKFNDVALATSRGQLDFANLQRRFESVQADSEFTVLALLPTLGESVNAELDLEGASATLARLVKSEREAKAEAARVIEEREQRALAAEGRRAAGDAGKENVVEGGAGANSPPNANVTGLTASMVEEGANLSGSIAGSTQLNPAAKAFEPAQPSTPPPPAEQTVAVEGIPLPAHSTSLSGPGQDAVEGGVTVVPPAPLPKEDLHASLSTSWAKVDSPAAEPPASYAAVVASGTAESSSAPTTTTTAADSAGAERAPSKAELWQQIKIISFTRTITTLYLLSLLALQTHVQLSLLGRTSYVESVLASIPPPSPSSSKTDLLATSAEDDLEMALLAQQGEVDSSTSEGEVERLYLSTSWWLLHEGAKAVSARVHAAVEEVVGAMALKSTIKYADLPALISQIRYKVEFSPDAPNARYSFLDALLPPTPAALDQTLAASASSPIQSPPNSPPARTPPPPTALLRLLDETSDLLSSADGVMVQDILMDRLVLQLVEGVESAFAASPPASSNPSDQGSRFEDLGERQVRLASFLPQIANQGKLALQSNPNDYVHAIEEVRELHEFAAVVYGAWDRDNLGGGGRRAEEEEE